MFQQTLSYEKTPVLSHAIPHFEMFMTELERLGHEHDILRPWAEVGLHWATKYYIWMDETGAYVVMMCKLLSTYYRINGFTANLQPSPKFCYMPRVDTSPVGDRICPAFGGHHFKDCKYNLNEYLPYLTALCRWSATAAGIRQQPPHH